MATFSVTYSFVANTKARAAEVNQNFTDVLTILQAHHHDPNIYTNAKPITNSGIAANAQILDTQLYLPITRSGLVNPQTLRNTDWVPGIITSSGMPYEFGQKRIKLLEFYDALTYITRDSTGNLVLHDASNGDKTLASLGAGTIYAASSGGTDAYAISLGSEPTSYVAGKVYYFLADVANTGPATLNINSLGAKTIKKNVSQDLNTGDIVANQISAVVYDGTNFQLLTTTFSAAIKFTNGQSSRSFAASSGAVTYAHGLGRTPKKVKITAIMAENVSTLESYSFGTYDGSTNTHIYRGRNSNAQYYYGADNTSIMTLYNTNSNSTTPVTATCTVDDTNITLTYSAPVGTGTFNFMWEAEG